MKKVGLFAVLASCLMLIAGCGASSKSMTANEMKKTQGETYLSFENIAKKYGAFMVEYSEDYLLDNMHYDALVQSDGDYTYINSTDGRTFIKDKNDWYWQMSEGAAATFAKVVNFSEDSLWLDEYLGLGTYEFESGEKVELTNTDSGYKYVVNTKEDDVDFGECTVKYTVDINNDYSIKDIYIVYSNKDGEVYVEESKFTYKKELPGIVETLKSELKASNGEDRHVLYHYVENGAEIKVFDGVVPKGFLCNAQFPEEFAAGNAVLYRDKELTTPLVTTPEETKIDLDIYVGEK